MGLFEPQTRVRFLFACLLAAVFSSSTIQANIFVGLKNLFLTPNNFHAIEKGKAYRSATMGPKSLARRIRKHGIDIVIILRALNNRERWWRREAGVLKRLGIQMYNVPLSAQKLPSAENVRKLITIMDHASKENKRVLIHCHAGADRTGMVAALWQVTQQGFSPAEAGKQLSDSFGHFSSRFPAPTTFVRSIPAQNSREWLLRSYNPVMVAGSKKELIPGPTIGGVR
jgi:undecaprenyl-diphosphatase